MTVLDVLADAPPLVFDLPRRWHRWRVHGRTSRFGVTTHVDRWFVLRANADRAARLMRTAGADAAVFRVPGH